MGNNVSAKIIIATHKQYHFPNDKIYLPLHVGKVDKKDLGINGDDTGDNISFKNASYCELTGLYWAWKNLSEDYIGLVHYRRHFSNSKKNSKNKFENILTELELLSLIPRYDVLVPKKRKYYIETLYSHYKHTHYKEHLDYTRNIIKSNYPDYIDSYDKIVNKTSGYMFNMFIMRKDLVDEYCRWLFPILLELEALIDSTSLTTFHRRFYGRVSEILFNVWLDNYKLKNPSLKIKELNHIHMDKINWFKKGMSFLRAKFSNKKYEGSF
ncbi:TPA: DUF4422 domain-containing protein [Klebsiella variicola subsp. variicola]|nr:DUF4422 domain-containing protein [Klebsiella variicola]APW87352.1 exopolysaccharide biosynthesis protein [Klebsiella variicola]KPS37005.1 exopolysaccharide biosynthesis protein [Klebsiella variicola]MBC5530880.1 DUF4422 domain-containing protein [Klebsiella variicola]MCE0393292.1 DUF4422 domain-containing protein [Klebsiella variicola subsp. variicola]MCX2360864.1 DUF4422 domain-containing protein [Klebsiella variicola]